MLEHWTDKVKGELKRWTSAMMSEEAKSKLDGIRRTENEYGVDPFGFNLDYALSAVAPFVWLYKHYFRVETHGIGNVPRGRVLFREGDDGDTLYLLAQGAIEISLAAPDARRTRIVTIAPGSLFGEAALIDGRPRSATAAVVERALLYEIHRSVLLEELPRTDPELAFLLMANLSRHVSLRLRDTTEMLRGLQDARG